MSARRRGPDGLDEHPVSRLPRAATL